MNFRAKGLPIARLKTKFKKGEDTILYYDEKSVGKPNFPDEIDLRKLTGGSSSSFSNYTEPCGERCVVCLR